MITRVLEMAKVTIAEHYTRHLAERRDGLRPPGRPRRLTRNIKEAITVKTIESFKNKITCTYSDMSDARISG
jgi:hypothetical protein